MDKYRIEVCENVAVKRFYWETEGPLKDISAEGLDAWLDQQILTPLRDELIKRLQNEEKADDRTD